MGDLFLALGYDQARFNIHKTGREIDVQANHRTEEKRVIAECKAEKDKVGGDQINKFIGALGVEKKKNLKTKTIGYFISLSGFTETAIEQEKEAGGDRVILLNGNQVIEELIRGNILVSKEKAMERAGRCAAEQPLDLKPETSCELLAHNIGWIWLIYFTRNKERTHFVLIHADGEALAPPITETIIQSDALVGGDLHSLTYLPPPAELSFSEDQICEAKTKYFKYLEIECGEITLEGLPQDQEVGFRRLKLENIFVPLHIEQISETQQGPSLSSEDEAQKPAPRERELVGKVFSECSRLAILSAPGGGKTTLLKRLAIAYAFPDRNKQFDDNLPVKHWLPLFIRCRQLGDLTGSPISEILCKIPERAEMSNLAKPFVNLIDRSLRSGDTLLLIDGLDEISDESARVSFVNQLRTFLATYPTINIIVTSREVGFRIVGGALSTHCKHYKIADFDNADIKRLTLEWHREVVGDRDEVRLEAEKLAKTICDSDRVLQLAKNPLLLTTLLLVKRWVGQLPTKRTVLYGKAIEVLLMTWNVEGYEPIDQEEAIPQLAFVAFKMMKDGVQRISSRRLKEILFLARKQMPEVLGYARLGVNEFIKRVEQRSSLIILSGYEIEEGTLYPIYEFRHLTFQEYLTARAVADGFYPNRKDNDALVSILKPYLGDENWKEVVPLAAVLAGRRVQPLIQHLIKLCKTIPDSYPVTLLCQCILDEIHVAPELLKEGLEWIARRVGTPSQLILDILRSRFGEVLHEVVQDSYIVSKSNLLNLGGALSGITMFQNNWLGSQCLTPRLAEKITTFLLDENSIQKAKGALVVMDIAYSFKDPDKLLKVLGDQLVPLLYSDEPYQHFAACWAFAWLGERKAWTPEYKPNVLSRLLEIWRGSQLPDVQYVTSWAISVLPIIKRELKPLPEPDSASIDFIKKQYSLNDSRRILASLVIGFYWKKPWTDKELVQHAASKLEIFNFRIKGADHFFKALGEPGKVQLEDLKQREISHSQKRNIRSKTRPKKPQK